MSNTTTVEGFSIANFSQETLDLQKTFCCNDKDSRKLIRWNGCRPGVYQSATTLFSSSDLALCSWFQAVTNYSYVTITLAPNQVEYLDSYDAKYILAKCAWPEDSLETKKLVEVGIADQAGLIGMSIPFNIGTPTTPTYRDIVIKDLFHINTMNDLTTNIKFNNISPYTVSISILYAK
jgi:hypothetical protein